MTRDPADVKFCENLLRRYRAIKNRIVILCEGDRNYLKVKTPQQYRQLDEYQDAAFWKETVPSWWRERKPVFIPCGGRSQVLNIREILLDLHYEDESNSYLCPEKLFVLIDLDLQRAIIDPDLDYDTEKLYYDLYQDGLINPQIIDKYKTIVTGLIHKESYFLEPDLQGLFDDSQYKISYKDRQLSLNNIYRDMLLKIESDRDLETFLTTATSRIKNILLNTPNNCTKLKEELDKQFNDPDTSPENKRQVIKAILTIIKSKPFWEEEITIESKEDLPEEYLLSPDECRDNLMLNIAKFYADKCEQSPEANYEYHICQWIKYFYSLCE